MKNTHIKAGQEVPIKLRKEIYREALEVVENWGSDYSEKFGCSSPFLCIILPIILYSASNDDVFDFLGGYNFSSVLKPMFPELKNYLNVRSVFDPNCDRINFLKSVI
jgi:hypothetical protein